MTRQRPIDEGTEETVEILIGVKQHVGVAFVFFASSTNARSILQQPENLCLSQWPRSFPYVVILKQRFVLSSESLIGLHDE